MSCLCGDPACPSCGPAQGYCPKCVRAGKDVCDCNDVEPEDFDARREEWIEERDL